jgi:hypothetical protein
LFCSDNSACDAAGIPCISNSISKHS